MSGDTATMPGHATSHDAVYHVADARDWADARAVGTYRISTKGATLDEIGFIHAAFAAQVLGVLDRFYRDVVDDLVLLVIDPARLPIPVRVEGAPGADDAFPHLYGPLPTGAVVDVLAVRRRGRGFEIDWTPGSGR